MKCQQCSLPMFEGPASYAGLLCKCWWQQGTAQHAAVPHGPGPVMTVISADELAILRESRARQISANADLEQECEALRKDAARYRWLKPRLRVRAMRAMSGTMREALDVRVGQCFFDTPTRGGKGYLDIANFEQECDAPDAEIDAAITDVPAFEPV